MEEGKEGQREEGKEKQSEGGKDGQVEEGKVKQVEEGKRSKEKEKKSKQRNGKTSKSMGKQMVRCCCRQFSAGRQNVHHEERSGRPTIIIDDLVELRTICLLMTFGPFVGMQRTLQLQELKALHERPNIEESRTIQSLCFGAS
ncbi:hypothetical protein ANN_01632 [Periplaneta americana]|uniref:Uncharacterized protein n=1 Tax=Periplaneta americana TaxID=6978 RepID=A0ABQ8TY74_PERAM|nr:hypothetical protein ANN_01632 [Periplaneta americana]